MRRQACPGLAGSTQRTEVAGEFFAAERGRLPQDARELAAAIEHCPGDISESAREVPHWRR